ncbi:MAG: hypothetical protein AB2A00_22155 [Myxococcota bacterium]
MGAKKKTAHQDVKLLAGALQQEFPDEKLAQLAAGALLALDARAMKGLLSAHGKAGQRVLEGMGLLRREGTAVEQWEGGLKGILRLLSKMDDEETGYLQHEISYTSPDLDYETLLHDIDVIAGRLLPLVPAAVKASAKGDPTAVAVKVEDAIDGLEDDGILVPEDYELGPKLTELVLQWELARAQRAGKGAWGALLRASKAELLDFNTCTRLLKRLSREDRADIARRVTELDEDDLDSGLMEAAGRLTRGS